MTGPASKAFTSPPWHVLAARYGGRLNPAQVVPQTRQGSKVGARWTCYDTETINRRRSAPFVRRTGQSQSPGAAAERRAEMDRGAPGRAGRHYDAHEDRPGIRGRLRSTRRPITSATSPGPAHAAWSRRTVS